MSRMIYPEGYAPRLNGRDTQSGIKVIKDNFEKYLAVALNLRRVSAPMFVTAASGLNDNLNGVERPVTFDIPALGGEVEVVHSLAKWKRYALSQYGFGPGEGLYTDMNAIRRDEELDNLHSVYVDQWDWEKVITKEQRTTDYLMQTVRAIYGAMKQTASTACYEFPAVDFPLAEDIFFVTAQELEDAFPHKTPKERENAICKEKKSVFIMGIGDALTGGAPHDSRAPDYDDWALNGDILVWNKLLGIGFELSSMGIRVSEQSLREQLDKAGCPERAKLPFHRALLRGELPYTVGGGIGQSRLCMLMLKKAHIGEVQASVWPEHMRRSCAEHGIPLL
ncbi:MAG: aspartate--ammonia ligase [Oscillospiraceae bacterium]|nr:aspartate--ammonia ligase [Oscillospiraceae bacterium]